MKNTNTQKQVSLAGVAKKGRPTQKKRRIAVKWVVLLVALLAIVLAVVGKKIYDAATAGPSMAARDMVQYTVTPDNISGKVSYYALGVTGEKSTDRMDMVALLCYDRKGESLSILQVPVATYIGEGTGFATPVLGDVWGKPQPLSWCATCRCNLTAEQVKEGKHTACGSKLETRTGSSFTDLCRVFNKQYGMPTDNFLVIPRDGLASLIDSLGGVDVKLSSKLSADGINYKSGVQTLSGKAAVYYATEYNYNGTPASDIQRMQRQRQVLAGLLQRLSKYKVAELFNADIASYGILSKLMNSADPVRFDTTSFGKSRLLGISESRADGIRFSKALAMFVSEVSDIELSKVTCAVLPGVTAKSGTATQYSVNKSQAIQLLNEHFNPHGLALDDTTVTAPMLNKNPAKADMAIATLDKVAVEQTGDLTPATTTTTTTTTAAGGTAE